MCICVCLCIVTAELSGWDSLHGPQSLEYLPPDFFQKNLPTLGLEDERNFSRSNKKPEMEVLTKTSGDVEYPSKTVI